MYNGDKNNRVVWHHSAQLILLFTTVSTGTCLTALDGEAPGWTLHPRAYTLL